MDCLFSSESWNQSRSVVMQALQSGEPLAIALFDVNKALRHIDLAPRSMAFHIAACAGGTLAALAQDHCYSDYLDWHRSQSGLSRSLRSLCQRRMSCGLGSARWCDQIYSPPDTGSVVTQHLGSGCIVVGDKGAENNSAPSMICVLGPLLPRVIPLLLGNTVGLTACERVRSCISGK